MLINQLFSAKSLKTQVFAYLAIFSLIAPSIVIPTQVFAAKPPDNGNSPHYEVEVTLPITVNGFDVDISGTGLGAPYVGQLADHHVQVNWGDNLTDPDSITGFVDDGSGNHFSGTWSNSHTYADPGTYQITVVLYHGQPSGNEVSGDAIVVINDVAVGQENTQETCTDNEDNDNDDLTDQADPDCAEFYPPVVATGTLTVIKQVVGGTATSSDFSITVGTSTFPGADTPGTILTLDEGAYTVSENASSTYTADFSACGNAGQVTISSTTPVTCTITNTYNIVPTDTPPEIDILGDNPATVLKNSDYVDAGATATDAEDGDFATSSIATSTDLNIHVVGTYSFVYSVTDTDNNTASATRVIQVVDDLPTPDPFCSTISDFLFCDDFEAGDFSLWSLAQDAWETATPGYLNSLYTATLEGNVLPQLDHSRLVKEISTEGLQNVTVSFDYSGSDFEGSDELVAYWYSTSTDLRYLSESPNPLGSQFCDTCALELNTDDWTHVSFDLPADADNNPDFTLEFRANFDNGNDSFMLENVVITGEPLNYSISGYKFNDRNADGDWSPGNDLPELGLSGWTITLLKDLEVDVVVATTTTANGGSYQFNNLEAGDYLVRETNQLGWTRIVPEGDGDNHVTLTTQAPAATDVNFGNHNDNEGTVCSIVFHDKDGDGVQDGGEEPLNGIHFDLVTSGDEKHAVSGSGDHDDGEFCFTSLEPNETYTLTEDMPEGWAVSAGIPQNINSGDGQTNIEPLDLVGNYIPSTVSGFKWYDEDGDADWDEDEDGLPNWTIRLEIGDTTYSTTTDEDGAYSFLNVAPGQYELSEVIKNGYDQTYPIDSELDEDHYELNIVSSSTLTNLNFGNDKESRSGGGSSGGGGCIPCRPCDTDRAGCDDTTPPNDEDNDDGNVGGGNVGGGQGGAEGGLALLTDGDAGDDLTLGDAGTTTDGVASTTDEDDTIDQVAAVGTIFGLKWWWWILILILLGLIGYYTFRDKENN